MARDKIQGGPAAPVWIMGIEAAIQFLLGAGNALLGRVDAAASTPGTYNLTLTVANTEYSQAMPSDCRHFAFQCRTENGIRFAFGTGHVATPTAPYNTLKAGDYYYTPPIAQGSNPSTIFFASATAGVVVEITSWV